MRLITRICKDILKEIVLIPRIAQCLFYNTFVPTKIIIIKAWVKYRKGRLLHFNLGDELNCFFISETTGKRVLVYPETRISKLIGLKNYVLIGSIFTAYSLNNSVIWGTGLMDNNVECVNGIPKQILSVRGPLTYDWLINQGIECPKVFGDPALLLSKFYNPNVYKKYRLGIIPHYIDIGNANIDRLCMSDGVKFIRVQGYEDWKAVIKEIMSCELILSSSLHGLIIAESYGVPSIWAEFQQYREGWEFKFHDFFASINKSDMRPLIVTNETTVDDVISAGEKWESGEIDYEKILETCPFELHKII